MHSETTGLKWSALVEAADNTHHMLEGKPAYTSRFLSVDKFRSPGLAVARDERGMFHINPQGVTAYTATFLQAFGFYEGLAAVQASDGWLHIRPDGAAAYESRFDWVGNSQQARCVVRNFQGRYFHIKEGGDAAYAERYTYAGDFREDAAVVLQANGFATHIDANGHLLHGKWYPALDVFHKGFARARDVKGWHHINRSGQAAYERRFMEVDAFYNGQAWAKDLDGSPLIINQRGEVLRKLQ
jgi:hypothetical protein